MPLVFVFPRKRDQLHSKSPWLKSKFKWFLFSGPSFSQRPNCLSIIHVKYWDPVAPATGRKLFWAAGTLPLLLEPQPYGGFENGLEVAKTGRQLQRSVSCCYDTLLSFSLLLLWMAVIWLFIHKHAGRNSKHRYKVAALNVKIWNRLQQCSKWCMRPQLSYSGATKLLQDFWCCGLKYHNKWKTKVSVALHVSRHYYQ